MAGVLRRAAHALRDPGGRGDRAGPADDAASRQGPRIRHGDPAGARARAATQGSGDSALAPAPAGIAARADERRSGAADDPIYAYLGLARRRRGERRARAPALRRLHAGEASPPSDRRSRRSRRHRRRAGVGAAAERFGPCKVSGVRGVCGAKRPALRPPQQRRELRRRVSLARLPARMDAAATCAGASGRHVTDVQPSNRSRSTGRAKRRAMSERSPIGCSRRSRARAWRHGMRRARPHWAHGSARSSRQKASRARSSGTR